MALFSCGSTSAQQKLSNPSDTIATQLTKLLKTITESSLKKPKYSRSRIVIDLERKTKFEIFSLVNPNRVVLQLPSMHIRFPVIESSPNYKADFLITDIRSGQSGHNKSRIIINVAVPVIVENARVLQAKSGRGAQLSLDLVPTIIRKRHLVSDDELARSYNLGGYGLKYPIQQQASISRSNSPSSHKHTIVLDPGHGGYDPGAQKYGVQEKRVVLAFALKLRDQLHATGRYKVLMTRSKDVFVELSERRKFAERHGASLFISVHADYARSRASGATIYSLRANVAKALKKSTQKKGLKTDLLTNKERKLLQSSRVSTGNEVLYSILEDLALRDVEATQFQTNKFSEIVVHHMGTATDMRKWPHQRAAFKVLKTATMPAVLIELAYISNLKDVRRLKSEEWRKKVSNSIVRAVDGYFADVKRIPM
ncbi:MAG: N-acetylmuramoyl-L-alanine amidase [Hyphomicrobiaceae bacterium]|nr:N-acetylmuramoyl-L-alanine amidase [Hyphomicrobiaceae bacterium]